ncbi:MAG: GAF domain-containing protein [candidate division WOR-3 bacterium]
MTARYILFKLDPEGRIEIAGADLQDFLGKKIEDISDWRKMVNPEDLERVVNAHRRLARGETLDIDFRIRSVRGEEFWIRERAWVDLDDGRRYYHGLIEDITEIKKAMIKKTEQEERMRDLNLLFLDINRSLKLEAIIRQVIDLCTDKLKYSYTTVAVVDRPEGRVLIAHKKLMESSLSVYKTSRSYSISELDPVKNLIRKAIEEPKIYRTRDLYDLIAPIFSRQKARSIMKRYRLKDFVVVPVVVRGQVVATLNLGREEMIDDFELEFLTSLARQIGMAIHTANLLISTRIMTGEWQSAIMPLEEPLAIIDPGGRVVMANQAYERLVGSNGLIGRQCGSFFNCPDNNHCQLKYVFRSRTRLTSDLPQIGDRLLTCVLYPLKGGKGDNLVIQHIQPRSPVVRDKEYFEKKCNELLALNRICKTGAHFLEIGDVLKSTLSELLEIIGVRSGAVFLYKEGRFELQYEQGLSEPIRTQLVSFEKNAFGEIFSQFIEEGEIQVFDRSQHPQWFEPVFASQPDLNHILFLPLVGRSGLVGLIMILAHFDKTVIKDKEILLAAASTEIALAVENSLLHLNTLRKNEELKRLTFKLLQTEEETRKKMACEIHDQIGSVLASARIMLDLLDHKIQKKDSSLMKLMEDIGRYIDESIKLSRDFIFHIYPAALEEIGLEAFLRSYLVRFSKQQGIEIKLRISIPRRLPRTVEQLIFRLVQEGLNNIAKHSSARSGEVMIEVGSVCIDLRISDNGKGFDIDKVFKGKNQQGFGLTIMRERVEAIGGTMRIESRLDKGTIIEISIPFKYPKLRGKEL